jgi:acyl carrier protein
MNNGTKMMDAGTRTLDEVKEVIAKTLGIQDRVHAFSAESALFGGVPELDSFGVVELAAALEERFGLAMDDTDFTAEVFETVGTLTAFVERHRRQPAADAVGR